VNVDRYDDRLIIQTNLIESYEFLMGFVENANRAASDNPLPLDDNYSFDTGIGENKTSTKTSKPQIDEECALIEVLVLERIKANRIPPYMKVPTGLSPA
jgi:hypothetical protein